MNNRGVADGKALGSAHDPLGSTVMSEIKAGSTPASPIITALIKEIDSLLSEGITWNASGFGTAIAAKQAERIANLFIKIKAVLEADNDPR